MDSSLKLYFCFKLKYTFFQISKCSYPTKTPLKKVKTSDDRTLKTLPNFAGLSSTIHQWQQLGCHQHFIGDTG